jgi:cytochrome c556
MRLLKSLILTAGIAVAGSAWAADVVIKYRQDQMKVLGGHMGSIAAIMKKEVPFSDQLAVHAQGLAATAAFTEAVFKEQALSSKSAAKAEIWSDWERFAADAGALKQAADKLAQTAAANDQGAVRAAMADVGKACKSCHDNFKTKK